MATIAIPAVAPRSGLLALLLAIFLGLTFAAVGQVALNRIECETVLLTGGDALLTGGDALLTGGRECHVNAGRFRITLPEWLSDKLWWVAP